MRTHALYLLAAGLVFTGFAWSQPPAELKAHKGNVFSGQSSATGGTADARNNVESVFLPAGVTGPYAVVVRATNIAGDGVPNSGGALDQDFGADERGRLRGRFLSLGLHTSSVRA